MGIEISTFMYKKLSVYPMAIQKTNRYNATIPFPHKDLT